MDEFDTRAPAGNLHDRCHIERPSQFRHPNGSWPELQSRDRHRTTLGCEVREPSMWVIDGRNDTGGITSNSSLRDGDRLVAQVPVQNSGGVPWNGTLAARLDGSSVHVFPDAVVALAPHQTQIVVLESPFGLQAGTHHLNVSINATGDGNRSDEMHNLTIVVDPPPRPSLTVGLESVSDVEHGVVATWNLTMQNHGERPWSGWVNCSIGSDVGTSSGRFTLPVGQVITSQVNLTARAGSVDVSLGWHTASHEWRIFSISDTGSAGRTLQFGG